MKKGKIIQLKKLLGVGLLFIAVFFILAGCSAQVGHKVFGVTGTIDDFFGWLAMIGTVVICTLSAYFLIKSGKQQ